METWKDVEGFDGLYQVSNLGNVKSFMHKINGKVLNMSLNNNGYYQATLKGKKHLAHRLVANAFLPNPFRFDVVNHKDGNPKNNHLENLEWCNHSTNQLHANTYGNCKSRVGSSNYNSTITEKEAREIFQLSFSKKRKVIANMYGVSYSVVHKIAKGEAWNQVTGMPRKRFTSKKAA